jgi:hypothetical protein
LEHLGNCQLGQAARKRAFAFRMINQHNEFSAADSHASAANARHNSRPRLGQLMLVIAAVAIGIVGIRNCDAQMRAIQIDRRHPVNWIVLASTLLASLSTALLVAGLLPPRSRLSELCRRPGFAACWVTALVMVIDAVSMIALNPDNFTNFEKFIHCFDYGYFWFAAGHIGFGVLISWTTLALAGCRRPEPNWIDRSGRALGVVWIIAFVADRFSWLL